MCYVLSHDKRIKTTNEIGIRGINDDITNLIQSCNNHILESYLVGTRIFSMDPVKP